MNKYVSRGLAAVLLTGISIANSGCQTVLRGNELKNESPVADVIEIDYSSHDQTRDYLVENDRAYLRSDNSIPNKITEIITVVPEQIRYRLPTINATYTIDSNNVLTMKYRSRVPAPDLLTLVSSRVGEGIEVSEFPNQNMLILSGNEEAFGDFKDISTLFNEFDLPPDQIRVNLRIVEYFNDNTYDRALSLTYLKKGLEAISLNLPSLADPTQTLTTGVDINPFFDRNINHGSELSGSIQFLDSYGKTNTLADIDMLVSNGQLTIFQNLASIPYPETVVAGNNILETSKYKDTGVDVSIIPYANEEGFITIKLEKAESGEQTGFIGTLQRPVFRTSNFQSEFIVKDGATTFAATSLLTRYKSIKRGLPGVNRIPIIKNIATARSIENNQSQLLYFITARVIPRESKVGIQEE